MDTCAYHCKDAGAQVCGTVDGDRVLVNCAAGSQDGASPEPVVDGNPGGGCQGGIGATGLSVVLW